VIAVIIASLLSEAGDPSNQQWFVRFAKRCEKSTLSAMKFTRLRRKGGL
jgi:hypothetical protein